MASTVTSTTIKTILTTPYSAWLNLVAIVLLLALLILKEIVSDLRGDWAQRLTASLDVVQTPLLLSFAFIFVVRLLEIL